LVSLITKTKLGLSLTPCGSASSPRQPIMVDPEARVSSRLPPLPWRPGGLCAFSSLVSHGNTRERGIEPASASVGRSRVRVWSLRAWDEGHGVRSLPSHIQS
jgi:hypothetical protein